MKEFVEKLIEKIKVTSLEIIVTGTKEKPYFEIKYKEVGKEDYNIGYSSYDLNNVLNWKEECFEIVNQLAEEYNNGWIPCSERLPEESELVLIYAESRARGGSIRVVGHLHNDFWFAQTSSDTLGLTGIGQFNVIAWQPLPAPFKKGE